MPTYIFKKSHIKNVCTAQVANSLASFDGCKMDAENEGVSKLVFS